MRLDEAFGASRLSTAGCLFYVGEPPFSDRVSSEYLRWAAPSFLVPAGSFFGVATGVGV